MQTRNNKHLKLAKELLEVPKKEESSNMPRIRNYKKNSVHQADLLYLPHDPLGHKYLLVVVDTSTRLIDAEPTKSHSSLAMKQAIKKIYNRDILDIPVLLQIDPGSEFKKDFIKYLKENKISYRVGKVGRSRQQAFVEGIIGMITEELMLYMVAEELKTDEVNQSWVKHVKPTIKKLNKKLYRKPNIPDRMRNPRCKDKGCELLNVGDLVRYKLDEPRKAYNNKTEKGSSKRFRYGDLRWSRDLFKIVDIYLTPNQPPYYKLDGIEEAVYTRAQLKKA